MSATGYITARAFTSIAQLPLKNVAVAVTSDDGTAIAMRLTDRNGLIRPIEIPVPDLDESQTPGALEKPYTLINLHARLQGYEQIEADHIQVFAGTTTYQNLEMIPLPEFPETNNITIFFDTPPQNL